jgi:hypothetical protein
MELPDLWGPENPCLVMVRVLDASPTSGERALDSTDELTRGDTAGGADRSALNRAR